MTSNLIDNQLIFNLRIKLIAIKLVISNQLISIQFSDRLLSGRLVSCETWETVLCLWSLLRFPGMQKSETVELFSVNGPELADHLVVTLGGKTMHSMLTVKVFQDTTLFECRDIPGRQT